ncbi:hypothetical protein H6F88_02010 [Oculatella sp. FACHB-28]|uniref:hypothetical protein n=1 Tax=Oculatella sp. FACHB-28 TaxID=2692845 RepID=UPI00168239D5|nr:hypothetical protein [Oculatella sp. FACHB-28]MBD2054809.1 hypothetical protein [Oculatella sp. FACHB-28]
MADTKLATFKCDADVWEAFKAKAEANKTNASALLKKFISSYLDGRIDLSQDEVKHLDISTIATKDELAALRQELLEAIERKFAA